MTTGGQAGGGRVALSEPAHRQGPVMANGLDAQATPGVSERHDRPDLSRRLATEAVRTA